MNNVASVKDRLNNVRRKTGKAMEQLLVTYGLERTIYRISISPYADKFTLKGGIFLYAIFDGNFVRMTTDIDLLAQEISNDVERMKTVFTEILAQETDDPLKYDVSSLEVVPITEFKEYHGVKVSTIAYLDRTRIPISIDIGFDDVIYPERLKMEFPSVLNNDGPSIFAYSLESCIAEKFEALVSLGYDNSRFKDYYDIYVLATTHDFDGSKLQVAIVETFKHRNTSLQKEIVAFEEGFTEDTIRTSRWNSFVKKKRTLVPVGFAESIEMIKSFIMPVVNAINAGDSFTAKWLADSRQWIIQHEKDK